MAIVTDDVELLVDFTNDKRELKKKLKTLLEKSKGEACHTWDMPTVSM
jgi:hypothetical protein